MINKVSVDVSKEAYEFGQLLVKFVSEVKKALDDGWQLGNDLPVVLSATMADLVPAMQKINFLPAEKSENLKAFSSALVLSSMDMASVFIK